MKSNLFNKFFTWLVIFLTLNITVFGFLAPYLVSYKDSFVVIMGVLVVTLTLYLDFYIVKRLFKIIGSFNEE